MPKYIVNYFYLATGMEGHADTKDYGVFEAETESDACDKAALAEFPVDKMYGPNNSYSARNFLRGCLSATLKK